MEKLQQNSQNLGLANRLKDAVMDSLNDVANAAEKANSLSPEMIERVNELQQNIDRAANKMIEALISERRALVEKLKDQNNV